MAQDFEVHFVSPKATQTTFNVPPRSQGFIPRMRSLFRRPTEQSTLLEKEEYYQEEEDISEGRYVSRRSDEGRNGYTMIPQMEEVEGEIPGVPTISERNWTTISAASASSGYATQPIMLPSSALESYHSRPSYLTRRARTLLFLSVPLALIAFHLISHHIGLFPGSGHGMDEMEPWMEQPTPVGMPDQ